MRHCFLVLLLVLGCGDKTISLTEAALTTTYSAADCTEPPVSGTDSRFGFTRGVSYGASAIPTGTFHSFLVAQKAGAAPTLKFFFSAPNLTLVGFMDTVGQLRKFNPQNNPIFVAAGACPGGGTIEDCSRASNGGVPMRSCPTSYGRFFDVDVNGDGVFDDMGVAFIDGTAVPLNFRILFVPINWTGTQAAFDAAAQNQVNRFTANTALNACTGTVEAVTVDVTTQGFNTFTCTADDCGIDSVSDFLRRSNFAASSYDLVVGLTASGASPCAPIVGCSNGTDTVWLEASNVPVLAHEIGHIYRLEDEYCSEEAGGDSRCAGASDSNFLGSDLGCDPRANEGCCVSCTRPGDDYFACCQGNLGTNNSTDRCIMSSAMRSTQNFCQRCRDRFNDRTEFACDNLPSNPFRDVLTVDLSGSSFGHIDLNEATVSKGRPSRLPTRHGRFQVTVTGPAGVLLDEHFDTALFDVGPQRLANFRYKVPVAFTDANAPPLVLEVTDNGQQTFRGTLFGAAPTARAGGDVLAECSSAQGTTVVLDGTGSSDPDGDRLTYRWTAPGIELDDPASATPRAVFPIGSTEVTLVVSDGVFDSAPAKITVRVEDHVAPDIQCPHPQAECTGPSGTAVAFSPTASDTCSPVTTSCAPPSGTAFALGNTPFSCTAIDAAGNSEACHSVVTVVDTQSPTIVSIAPSQTVLWPPNHRMVPVSFAVSVADVCDPSPACTIASISSNEPINGSGDGNTDPDWEILGGLQANLRAERAGTGTGRRYTISVRCVDGSGNASSGTAVVTVPKSR